MNIKLSNLTSKKLFFKSHLEIIDNASCARRLFSVRDNAFRAVIKKMISFIIILLVIPRVRL